MFVYCVHPVAVLNVEFYMTYSLLILVEDTKDDHMEVIHHSRSHNCLVGSHRCLILFPHVVAVNDFVEVCVRVLRCCECK